jgi:putative SOS response-associated peptidase YedK
MCGRFTQNYTWAEVHAFLSVFGPPRNLQPHYNIAPTDTVGSIGAALPASSNAFVGFGIAGVVASQR